MRKGGRKEGRKDTPSGHNTRLCCAVAVALASGSCADGISGMAGHTGAVLGSRIAVHVFTVIVAILLVRIAMVGRRPPPGMEIIVVDVMGAECL